MKKKEKPKAKQILAMAGIILLVGMYLVTFICSLIQHPLANQLMWASLFCTMVVPILIYVIQLGFRLGKPTNDRTDETSGHPQEKQNKADPQKP